ncbi:ABC transporter transmembrane domain-containing protein [Cupriavidus basilensis]|uniref:ABC transporter transmembrane domain-containing protein n=1 Tax=Cupriavidus basilensis TaxID=68895 RepID=UPI001D765752|nr:ATP-binding cassette domain-containing protein [Cupriavidus basilensis]
MDTGLQCLMLMTKLHGIAADTAQLLHQFGRETFTVQTILLAAKKLGLTARRVRQDPQRLDRAPLPAIAIDTAGHFFLVGKVDSAQEPIRVLIQRPGQPPEVLGLDSFTAQWTGELILFASKACYAGDMARFDFTWFIPAVIKYRKTLGEVLMISLVLQIIGLATPMFFQVVMDKVLVNHAMKTLNVIAIGLIAATLFESALTGIRTAVFANTSSKIDVELGTRLFGHLLSLPISYFQVRRAGDSVARIRELENIRAFLTSNAMTLVLDIVFSFVFLAVMLWYSKTLTLVVVASIPAYLALSFVFTPILRARLNDKFNKGAENQSFLVETLTGMDTIKAMAVEPRWQQKWDKQLAAYVSAGLSTTNIALVASGGVTLVSKLVTAGIMWLGALLVVDNKMTVGELVAFNIIEDIIAAARLAGAHDFICELPEGYDTLVGEHGTGLSGGQRQRIAIARALIANPRVLIFDEATSALDYESEKRIQDNMRQICAGRTVLIIAHRLSAVRDANRIVVMERGQIVEVGSHDELLQHPQGIYRHLYHLQTVQRSHAQAASQAMEPM